MSAPARRAGAGQAGHRVQQLLSVWNALTPRRRMIAGGAALAVFAAVLILARLAAAPSLALLYAGLDEAAAGEVIAALDRQGVAYEIRGSAIHVDVGQRDSLRMSLAAEGLPAHGPAGYEILDGLSGFSTTAQMFDAAYWRAREGELARTILAMPGVRAARVHVAAVAARPFGAAQPPSASVSVRMGGGAVSARQAETLRHLVAAAVPGLEPGGVAVIDAVRGLVPPSGADAPGDGADRAERLRRDIVQMMEAHVGPGNAVVAVNLVTSGESERIVERRIDPQGRVAISTDTEERSASGRNAGPAGVSVASNLPDGDANAERSSSNQESESRERVNFEVSETRREVERGPGAVARVDIAVLVNAEAGPGGALAAADLGELEALVKSAAGFDAARGDTVTLRALPFRAMPEAGEAAAPGWLAVAPIDAMRLIQLGVAALVALLLGLFVLRPLLTPAGRGGAVGLAPALPGPQPGAAAQMPAQALAGAVARPALPAPAPRESAAGEGGAASGSGVEPLDELRRLAAAREDETASILRDWLATATPEEARA